MNRLTPANTLCNTETVESINKSNLIDRVINSLAFNADDETVRLAVDEILNNFAEVLAERGRIEVRGFGSFRMNKWARRYARNPVTGESWYKEPRDAIYFRVSPQLLKRLNKCSTD